MSAAERQRNRENYLVLFDFYQRESGLSDERVKDLSAEAQAVPQPTPEHGKAYQQLGKIFSWHNGRLRQRVPLLRRLKNLRWFFSAKNRR